MSDHDDNEEEFSHSFSRYVRVLERMNTIQERQMAMAEKELNKCHGFQIEVGAKELRVRVGGRALAIREYVELLEKLPEQPEAENRYTQYDPFGIVGVATRVPGGPFRPPQEIINQLKQRAFNLIEWAAHLIDDRKIYVLSTHDWETLFTQPYLSPLASGP